ncbi:MAG: hypothetical protein ACREMX_13500 [Gemmatimonadales bacterium]
MERRGIRAGRELIRNPVTGLLGIRHPIISAPMGMISGGRLAAAAEFSGRRNDFTARWHGREAALEEALGEEQPRYAKAVAAWDFDVAAVWAGEGVDLIGEVAPARQIVERLVAEAEEARAAVTKLRFAGSRSEVP